MYECRHNELLVTLKMAEIQESKRILGTLPEWATVLSLIGFNAHQQALRSESRTATCVTVPTDALAAAMVALGAAMSSFVQSIGSSVEQQLEKILTLPAGSPVTVRKNNELRSGWFVGPRTVMGNDCIEYDERTHGGREKRYLFMERCVDMHPMPIGSEPFVHARTPFEDESSIVLLNKIAPAAASCAAAEYDDTVAVVTVVSRFRSDLNEYVVLDDLTAPLVDLVRPDRDVSSGVSTRTRVIPSSTGDLDLSDSQPQLVIFDGAQAYLRLRHEFARTSSVTLLDRWDNRSEDAAHAFIGDSAPYGASISLDHTLVGSGIEVLAYEVEK